MAVLPSAKLKLRSEEKLINSAVLAAAGVLASAETDVTVGGKSFIILSEFWPRCEVRASRGAM